MVSLYVSYSWDSEKESQVVEKLEQACQKRGIELRQDKGQIAYGESIRKFMQDLGAGRHVVLVLSEAYFKSEYCMYELKEIYDNRDFRRRVYPIVLSGTRFHKAIDRVPYVDYWKKRTSKLERKINSLKDPKFTKNLRAALDNYAIIHQMMDELLDILADMNALTEDVHVETDFAALLDRIAPPSASVTSLGRKRLRQHESWSRKAIREQIHRVLEQNLNLNEALEVEARSASKDLSQGLASLLCEVDFETTVEGLLRPATTRSLKGLDAQRQEFTTTWEDAKSVLAWLSLLAVDEGWIQQQAMMETLAEDFRFEIVVNTPCGVEIVSARYRQLMPKLHVDHGKVDVFGREAFACSPFSPDWNDDYALGRLLLEIWNSVFPEETRRELSEADIRKLNGALKYRERHQTHHYYIPVATDQQSPLCRPEFYQKLIDKLPAITVIYFKSSGGKPALFVNDEYDFMTIIREFLSIPHHLGKRS